MRLQFVSISFMALLSRVQRLSATISGQPGKHHTDNNWLRLMLPKMGAIPMARSRFTPRRNGVSFGALVGIAMRSIISRSVTFRPAFPESLRNVKPLCARHPNQRCGRFVHPGAFVTIIRLP